MEQGKRDPGKDPQTYAIIGAAMAVHNEMGCGFLEPVDQECLAIELRLRGIPFERELPLGLHYKGHLLTGRHYRPDFICWNKIIVELKTVEQLTDKYVA